jgi:hypothetical protein
MYPCAQGMYQASVFLFKSQVFKTRKPKWKPGNDIYIFIHFVYKSIYPDPKINSSLFLGQVLILLRRSVLSFYTRARHWVKKNAYAFLKNALMWYFSFSVQKCIVGRSVTCWPYSPMFEDESCYGVFTLDMLSCFEKRRQNLEKPRFWAILSEIDIFRGLFSRFKIILT